MPHSDFNYQERTQIYTYMYVYVCVCSLKNIFTIKILMKDPPIYTNSAHNM